MLKKGVGGGIDRTRQNPVNVKDNGTDRIEDIYRRQKSMNWKANEKERIMKREDRERGKGKDRYI